MDDVEQTQVQADKSPDDESAPEGSPPEENAKSVAEPEFKEGMSVNEAMAAVPDGGDRLNIEQEALSRPLMEEAVYEPCKLGNRHFKLKVAVWDGKAVGIDVTTTPKNEQLADCIKTQVRQLTWKDKVKSLNTVSYEL